MTISLVRSQNLYTLSKCMRMYLSTM